MDISFAQPAGAWFLLGIPAIIAIHFLQSRTRRILITTLFLVESMAEENRKGAVWTRLRSSLQLWLQLLAVVLISWLASKPVWIRPDSVQVIAVVMDHSYSMQAFRTNAVAETTKLAETLSRSAGRTEWYLLSSDITLPVLYRGDQLQELRSALDVWSPDREGHSAERALRRARDLVGPEGLVVLVTDHLPDSVPEQVEVLAVGRPLANSGFTGIRFETNEQGEREWIASLVHYGGSETTRLVQVAYDESPLSAPDRITLAPGRPVSIRGRLPPDARRGRLVLNPDDYPVDDSLCFVVPELKTIPYSLTGFPQMDQWLSKIMSTVDAAFDAPDHLPPALVWRTFAGRSVNRDGNGIWMYAGSEEAGYETITAVDHPLTRELNWSGFLGRVAPEFELRAGDQVLVWMGRHPLVVLRNSLQGSQLILCFDPLRSNAERLPAVILCLHRFIETVRIAIDGYEAVNLETHQEIQIRGPALVREEIEGRIREYSVDGRMPIRAPARSGYLRITRDDRMVMDAGIYVADTAEADLTKAVSRSPDRDLVLERRIIHSRRDMLTPLWFALLGLATLGSWIAGRNGQS